ncbi:alpha-(1,3)-fucosyltransferase c-like [Plakobranchus ocellatus]|uniref:Fucosyltransferase n=1 Tax=Plakobranchus ocellatus TaxID=259542 RepID=A0AAV4DGV4_9GAST|nr:alpha-(1,3)-fucosyltransferase c-like [Plakobranchus ocellatus]
MKMSWRVRSMLLIVLAVSTLMSNWWLQDYKQAVACHKKSDGGSRCESASVLGRRGDEQDAQRSNDLIFSIFNYNRKVDQNVKDNNFNSSNNPNTGRDASSNWAREILFSNNENNNGIFESDGQETSEFKIIGNVENRESIKALDKINENIVNERMLNMEHLSDKNQRNDIGAESGGKTNKMSDVNVAAVDVRAPVASKVATAKHFPARNSMAETSEEDVCQLLEKRTEHLSPLTTINRRIMVADPPLTREQISEVYNKACGLTPARAPDGQATWKEGGILYIPKNVTGEKRFDNVTVYNADFEPYVPYNHTLFFEGRQHPPVADRDRKIILARMAGWDDVTTPSPLRACPDLPCLITTDSQKYARTAAAISFNGQSLEGRAPQRYRPDQVFIMYFYEPLTNPWPAYHHLKNPRNDWASIFNWTMTYHITSDILATYGMVRRRPVALAAKNYTEIVARKTKKVAWFVSHCRTESEREKYVAELQKYISVDIYGACGPLKCKKEVDTTCFSQVGRDYKFYLAFENAMCEDYTTEKLYRIFKSDAVVVSRGNSFSFRSLPSGTFIDASEFPSPHALAKRLRYLDSHDEEYTALLRRKDDFFASYQDYPHYIGKKKELWVKYTWENIPLCEVCQRIWNLDKYHKNYPDILAWLNARKCRAPTDL